MNTEAKIGTFSSIPKFEVFLFVIGCFMHFAP